MHHSHVIKVSGHLAGAPFVTYEFLQQVLAVALSLATWVALAGENAGERTEPAALESLLIV